MLILLDTTRTFQFTHPGRGATAQQMECRGRTLPVSIHAPREGCDQEMLILLDTTRTFQFTHPGRGATAQQMECRGRTLPVSIHAPREGCDSILNAITIGNESFNSRTPGGVRHRVGRSLTKATKFQFTHPGRGATTTYRSILLFITVSIHAPREGCDLKTSITTPNHSRFNSRTPGGVRPSKVIFSKPSIAFQFTHPGRGATQANH